MSTVPVIPKVNTVSMNLNDVLGQLAPVMAVPPTSVPETPTNVQVSRSVSDYTSMQGPEHVYNKPNMYIGSIVPSTYQTFTFNISTQMMEDRTFEYIAGVERLYLEILTNASDHVGDSRRAGMDPGRIEITIKEGWITIKNYGITMPVKIRPQDGVYVPQAAFGQLMTGTNLDNGKTRHGIGTNGIGSKATNIFSKVFHITVHDPINKLLYNQTWRENMTICEPPVITPHKGKESSVQVSYFLDFVKFGWRVPSTLTVGNEVIGMGGYPSETYPLFLRHAIDISFNAKVGVVFNGVLYNFPTLKQYAALYFGAEAVKSSIIHYQWPEGTEVVQKRKGHSMSKDTTVIPEVELLAMDTPDNGFNVSFVNCMMTRNGGVHLDAAVHAVVDSTVKEINDKLLLNLKKQKKSELTTAEKRGLCINIADVKPHISILLSVHVQNPNLDAQTKTKLESPKINISVSEDNLKTIMKWRLMDRLFATVEAKQFNNSSKTDGKKRGRVLGTKGIDANYAGTKDSDKCTLLISEGSSGSEYSETIIELNPTKRDYIGVMPMKGKGLNVMNAHAIKIDKNKEIANLKKMLGLCEGVDYRDPKAFATLRYGKLLIMADSDVDGKHIIGLIINFFHCRFPSLLARGFVMHYRSPIIRVFNVTTRQEHKFFFKGDYDSWATNIPDIVNKKKWRVRYLKGLGGSKDADIVDDMKSMKTIQCVYDDAAPANIRLIFDRKLSEQRKKWIALWNPLMGIQDIAMQPISTFFQEEFILFATGNNLRALPRLEDGFVESRRKIIYTAQDHWTVRRDKKEDDYEPYKVGGLGPSVIKATTYEHGESNLTGVITGMAQDFVGANNIPWFTKNGQLGSRYNGGIAAAARYVFVAPRDLWPYILRIEDEPILHFLESEGQAIEPETYYPLIPMILVNGIEAIGWAWSSYIPHYDPLTLIDYLKAKINKTAVPQLIPWYRGFNGLVTIVERESKSKSAPASTTTSTTTSASSSVPSPITPSSAALFDIISRVKATSEPSTSDDDEDEVMEEALNDEEADDIVLLNTAQKISMRTLGSFHVREDGVIVVTELPIGRWPHAYHIWLEGLQEKKIISKFTDNTAKDSPIYFEIFDFKEKPTYKNLRLQRTYGMCNMIMLDKQNKPKNYGTAQNIIEHFYIERLEAYRKRKVHTISDMERKMHVLDERIRFVTAVVNKQIKVLDADEETETFPVMDQLGLSRDLLEHTSGRSFTKQRIDKLMKEKGAILEKLEEIKRTPETTIYLRELEELEKMYIKIYGGRRSVVLPPSMNLAL